MTETTDKELKGALGGWNITPSDATPLGGSSKVKNDTPGNAKCHHESLMTQNCHFHTTNMALLW
jgi:hypothetical protein